MAGKFRLYEDKAGKFRFQLLTADGHVIAKGQGYETKAAAKKGIESVVRNTADYELDDQT